jgi:hypothetical protein
MLGKPRRLRRMRRLRRLRRLRILRTLRICGRLRVRKGLPGRVGFGIVGSNPFLSATLANP